MIYDKDSWLKPYRAAIDKRHKLIVSELNKIAPDGDLAGHINNHLYYGLHEEEDSWVFREWAPSASRIFVIGDFNNWKRVPGYALKPIGNGNWELRLPKLFLRHGELYKFFIEWPGGGAERLPAYVTRVVQDPETKVFAAQVWAPSEKYEWKYPTVGKREHPFIYECHIGMSSEEEKVASFEWFRKGVLPRVKALGYDCLQIMALQEHPYYGSYGYQVSNFFALSSRFGTPEEFKALVDEAHSMGIAVVMDLVHSHSVENEAEGLSRFDGREDLYFYKGQAGYHPAWGSRCFDYGKDEVKRFLLSNCKYWMEEYHLDGFRFDGVTSMMYWDHGLGRTFGDYAFYYDSGVDENAVCYLALANILIHQINPDAITIAEDVSGMAGLAAPFKEGGLGFDFRMSMGVADHWIKWLKEQKDEEWSMGEFWWELTRKRADEKTVSYAECHDQALVGDKTLIFRLIDSDMYWHMDKGSCSLTVDRGVALHKMIRLVTAATAGDGYLNFMGNEFGHPEWIDFPREGNGWSYSHARRLWSLTDNPDLRYQSLQLFDSTMVNYLKDRKLLEKPLKLILSDEQQKILIFSRGKSIFAFNFHPCNSASLNNFNVIDNCKLILDTDDRKFGGFGRLESENVFLPCRCGLVFEKK